MRFVILFVILTLNFSGFSTAAEAYADLHCNQLSQTEHCTGLEGSQPDNGKDHPSGNSHCIDCHACCVNYSLPVSQGSHQFVTSVRTIMAFFDQTADGSAYPPQLRPPRILA